MPYFNENPSESAIQYFLNAYPDFHYQAEEFKREFSKDAHTYQWVLEHSSVTDSQDYNRLILIGFSKEFGEIKRISCLQRPNIRAPDFQDNPFDYIESLSTKDGFARLTLTIGSYTVPNTTEAIERGKHALLEDFNALKYYDIRQCIKVEKPIGAELSQEVPDWLIEDMIASQDATES